MFCDFPAKNTVYTPYIQFWPTLAICVRFHAQNLAISRSDWSGSFGSAITKWKTRCCFARVFYAHMRVTEKKVDILSLISDHTKAMVLPT